MCLLFWWLDYGKCLEIRFHLCGLWLNLVVTELFFLSPPIRAFFCALKLVAYVFGSLPDRCAEVCAFRRPLSVCACCLVYCLISFLFSDTSDVRVT